MSREPIIVFVESRPQYGPDGSLRAETDYVFMVNHKPVTIRVHWQAIRTLDGENLSRNEIIEAATTWIQEEVKRGGLMEGDTLLLDSAAMDLIAEKHGWWNRFYSVSVSDYRSSVEDWHRAQSAPESELPEISDEQRNAARRTADNVEQYRRGLLAGIYGNRRQRAKARRLGEYVQQVLVDEAPGYCLVEILWQGDRLRWLVRIRTPEGRVVGVPISFELADDAVDAGILQELEKLKRLVVAGIGRDRASA